MSKNKILIAIALFALLLAVAASYGVLPAAAAAGLRWLAISPLIIYAALRRSLTAWIMVSMVVGAEFGHDFPNAAMSLQVLSLIFLKLVKTIIAPLIFSTLVVGIAGHSNLRQVGRMGVKALIYFEVVTTLAIFIGLAAINISRAGVGIHMPTEAASAPARPDALPAARQSASDMILHIFPENIAKSVAEGQILQVVVFSVIFAIALSLLSAERRAPLLNLAEALSETMFKFTNLVMYLAPVGVGAAIAYTVGHMGLGILVNLFKLLATLYAALVAFILLVLLPIALAARVPLREFIKAIAKPVSIAFATTSSEAALPSAMEAMEAIGVPRPIVAFVMPTGYSFNLDGSTLYLSLAAVFVAQAAGINLGFGQQLVMVATIMLASKGIAGVPRSTLVILMGMAQSFNLPLEPIFIILGVDTLMDMGRTSVNVVGNCLATVVVARWEGEFGKDVPSPVVMEAVES